MSAVTGTPAPPLPGPPTGYDCPRVGWFNAWRPLESSGPAYGEGLVASANMPRHSGNPSLQETFTKVVSAPWSPQRAQQVVSVGSAPDVFFCIAVLV